MTAPSPAPFRAGFGRASITAYAPALPMFGWGHPTNVPRRVAAPLYARALALAPRVAGPTLVYVCCDLGMISEDLRRAVRDRLDARGVALADAALMLTATHTHAGPSGFSDYLLFAVAAPGYVPAVRDAIARGVVEAIERALAAMVAARVYLHEGVIPLTEPLAFNRTVRAFNRNRDVTPVTAARRDEATDRAMVVLRVDAADDGRALGVVTWFGLHGTCLHRDQQVIHGDHKGEAAARVEAAHAAEGNAGFVAIFAQTAPADVTPNHRWDARRNMLVGRYDDDLASAAFVGEIQARHALAIAARARDAGRELAGETQAALTYVDMFAAPVAPAFADGRAGVRTAPPVLGWPFVGGTIEGQGPLGAIACVLPALSTAKAWIARATGRPLGAQGVKVSFWDLGAGSRARLFGVIPARSRLARCVPEVHTRYVVRALAEPHSAEAPWVPRVVPLQVFRVGELALAAVPLEPTVTAGRRMARAVARAFGAGVTRAVVNGYANAYAGYVVTPEEYDAQRYEGASTLYGPWTLPAVCTGLSALARALAEGRGAQLASAPAPARPARPRVPVTPGIIVGGGADHGETHGMSSSSSGSPSERLQWFYERLARDRERALDELPRLFTDDIVFRDPFRETRGMTAFRTLFDRMLRQYRGVRFTGFRRVGDEREFTLTYQMHLRMIVGPEFVTPMASVCRAREGRVSEVIDYYDFPTGLVSPLALAHGTYRAVVRALFL